MGAPRGRGPRTLRCGRAPRRGAADGTGLQDARDRGAPDARQPGALVRPGRTLNFTMSDSFLVVTAADPRYFDLARAAIAFVRDRAAGPEAPIAFFDLGCTPQQVQWLRSQVQFLRAAEWEFDFPPALGCRNTTRACWPAVSPPLLPGL